LKVPVGQVVGIVGPSGSGKSTLTKLIQRLYVPESGRILIDGVDLTVADVTWLRRQIGAVLQENVLFNRSIRDNIALADPGMAMERVIAAAELAGAHDFIIALPDGYNTMVGERGASLSGGQRQRIAIARALVTDPRILIFDEATSALDYESERIIQQNMKDIAKGRTVLVIAHRLSTVRTADRIVTLERGRLVEDGTHDVLIELDPTVNAAERDHLRNDLLAEKLNIARLRAALGDDPVAGFAPPADADSVLIGAQRQLLLHQVTEHRAKVAALSRQQAQKEAEKATTAASIHKLEKTIPVVQARVDIRKTL